MTLRKFCVVCEQFRNFTYVRSMGHSACSVCGARFGLRKKGVVDLVHHELRRRLPHILPQDGKEENGLPDVDDEVLQVRAVYFPRFFEVFDDAAKKWVDKHSIYGDSWRTMKLTNLFERLENEQHELEQAESREQMYEECLDIVNVATMLATRLRDSP